MKVNKVKVISRGKKLITNRDSMISRKRIKKMKNKLKIIEKAKRIENE